MAHHLPPHLMLIQEATGRMDALFRAFARHQYQVLLAWARANKNRVDRLGFKAPEISGWIVPWTEIGSITAGGDIVGEVPPLWLGFGTKDRSFSLMPTTFRGKSQLVIVLPVLQRPYNTSGLDDALTMPGVGTRFIHEYVHYLDAGTARAAKAPMRSGHHYQRGEVAKYFLDPTEFNAYFQQGASDLEQKLETLQASGEPADLADIRMRLPRSFRHFVVLASGFWLPEFIATIKPKRRAYQRFLKRMAVLHRYLLDKYRPA